MKTGPFAEHSNTLWGISGVAEWSKVNSGLIKMYKAEVCVSPTRRMQSIWGGGGQNPIHQKAWGTIQT